MNTTQRFLSVAGLLSCLLLIGGCESSSSDSGGSGPMGGTWHGTTAGRPLTMTLTQSGTSLSGSYRLQNPDFGESLSGTASSEQPPATAVLSGGADRQFRITFSNANSLSGGFYKGNTQVGSVSATR